jgi:hypothetical protein
VVTCVTAFGTMEAGATVSAGVSARNTMFIANVLVLDSLTVWIKFSFKYSSKAWMESGGSSPGSLP